MQNPSDFGLKYGNQKKKKKKKTQRKDRMDKQHEKKIRRTRRRPESGNTERFTQNYIKKISNWKTSGHDGKYGFWFKKFTSIHDRLTLEMSRCLQGRHVPEWTIKGYTTLIQKDPSKESVSNNYRPITCLPMMWKISTAQIREEIYFSLTNRGLFPGEQKGYHKGFRGTAELLNIYQHILNERKTRQKSSYGLY